MTLPVNCLLSDDSHEMEIFIQICKSKKKKIGFCYKFQNLSENICHMLHVTLLYSPTVVPTKSDSDVIVCLQLLNQILTCTHHLS